MTLRHLLIDAGYTVERADGAPWLDYDRHTLGALAAAWVADQEPVAEITEALESIHGHLASAALQRHPDDDEIIAGHIVDARDTAKRALTLARRAAMESGA